MWRPQRALAGLAPLRAAIRWEHWSLSKLPFVWTACALAAAESRFGDPAILWRSAAVILFACLCGAFGHVANDHADRGCDRLAGRLSPVAMLTPRTVRLLLAGLALTAFLLLTAAAGLAALLLGTATLALAAGYSLPPFRLKARGAAGLWSAAAAQRTLPVLTAFAALGPLNGEALAFAAVAQLTGLRWMLIHQLDDARNDARAGIATYVATAGEERARRLLRGLVFPLELAAIAVALWAASAESPRIWALPAAGILASGAWILLCGGVGKAYSLEDSDRQPLTFFYQAVWPIGAGLLLALSQPALWPLPAAFVLWEWRFLRVQSVMMVRMIRRRIAARRLLREETTP